MGMITLNQKESSYLQTLINTRFQDSCLRDVEGPLQTQILSLLEPEVTVSINAQQNGYLQTILQEAYEVSARIVSITGGAPARKPYTPYANQNNNNFNLLQLITGILNKVIAAA